MPVVINKMDAFVRGDVSERDGVVSVNAGRDITSVSVGVVDRRRRCGVERWGCCTC